MILSRAVPESPIHIEELTDPDEIARARARRARFDRNWEWFKARAQQIYDAHRGKHVYVAGQEAFAADTPAEARALALAAHPDDEGRFSLFIPRERMARIYVAQG
jgi:hypothetical protein